MKVTEMVKGRTEYISVCVMPLICNENGNTTKTGKQASFQIRDKGAKNVQEIKEILQYLITLGGVMSIYKDLKKGGYGWINGSISFLEANNKLGQILSDFAIELGVKVGKSKYNKAIDKAKSKLGKVIFNDIQNNTSK